MLKLSLSPFLHAAITNFAGKCGSDGGKNFGCLFIGTLYFLAILSISISLYFCLEGCLFGTGKPPVLEKTAPT